MFPSINTPKHKAGAGVYKSKPKLDAGLSGAQLTPGFLSGHIGIGNGVTKLNSFVTIQGDEYYTDVAQEVRGLHGVVRNQRTTPDEPTLGWDFFGVVGAVVVTQYNTQYLRGNHKAVTGELWFEEPITGTYSVLTSHNFQATIPVLGANVTLEKWYGFIVNSPPTGGGDIDEGYGIRIEAISLPTIKAAIKMDGQGESGQIKWIGTSITEDSGGKLEVNLNSQLLAVTNALVATSATAGGQVLPANPSGFWRVLIGGTERKIPYYEA